MVKSIAAAAGVAALLIGAAVLPASARSRHGIGHGFSSHGSVSGVHAAGRTRFATEGRDADGRYVKAASDQLDRLLDTRMKSICRGC
ncbi:conserved exported hypothetical protein [Bradyrhizobium sp. STM 3843]|nr:conserved exported hypothetical protein [Bradyrhizobium sp. STM 3843]